ncbi:dipeptidase [Sphingomonas sp. S1-29]|uniref:dipeptidase n=1 Tax=Sphingomonas sp. S1-29 TaxID=2991074 RepID=UPI0022407F00|nr:dipeptidase [Sphingomonas sp. S1-29]UZK69428.1 dipeptidase [Sphingomonas sp. S1-29]
MKRLLGVSLALVLAAPALAQTASPSPTPDAAARLERFLATRPVVDGHNDLPWELRDQHGGRVETTDLSANGDKLVPPVQTDIARLRAGGYGGQFWSLWIPATITGAEAVKTTREQIALVRRLVARYPNDLALATTSAEVRAARQAGRIASLMGIEGAHQIADNDLSLLRDYRQAGVLYMTLTHSKNVSWADSATDTPNVRGLTPFGLEVIAEMNRIGMLVDLSHVSADTAKAALAATRAPVIFSHSNAFAVNPHPRNVPDDVLRLTAANGGVVMVNVYPVFVSAAYAEWNAKRGAEAKRLGIETDDAGMGAWTAANPAPRVTAADVAAHVEHIARIAGRDHVGLGGDYDGIGGTGPEGMKGADGWRLLFAELIQRGWSDADLAKLAGGNVLRVLARAEAVAGGKS